jgi:signal transduction histidine kinase
VVLSENGIDPLSSLIVPMMIKDTVLGTLEVQAHENNAFAEDDVVALEMAANLAAVAIENVRLIETEAAAREAAESANRAKDEFLSVLSHELRTPLNAMLGWVRMLKAGVLDAENSERALEVIERNTRLQSSLIEDLLDVSRIISGKMRIETELVDLVSVVQTVSETTKPLADAKAITFRFTRGAEPVFLNADPVRLQQVVSNLLQNSIKFTPAGGKIEITLERNEMSAILAIRDTGVGIEPELLRTFSIDSDKQMHRPSEFHGTWTRADHRSKHRRASRRNGRCRQRRQGQGLGIQADGPARGGFLFEDRCEGRRPFVQISGGALAGQTILARR